jgi:hypothetical protein
LVNSGFYDNRVKIRNVAAKEKYVLLYKENTGRNFTVNIGERRYVPTNGNYNDNFENDEVLLTFTSRTAKNYPSDDATEQYAGYKYVVAEVNSNYNKNEKEFLRAKY